MRAVVMAPGDVLLPELLHFSPPEPTPARVPDVSSHALASTFGAPAAGDIADIVTLDELERAHIVRVVAATQGHRGRTCELLGITRPTLDRKLKKYGIELTRRRAAERP